MDASVIDPALRDEKDGVTLIGHEIPGKRFRSGFECGTERTSRAKLRRWEPQTTLE